jgi:hypothetical protein
VKRRFPILENTIRLETERIPSITVACFVLHNVSKYLQDEDVLADFQFHPDVAHHDLENIRIAGQRKRHELAEIICNEVT